MLAVSGQAADGDWPAAVVMGLSPTGLHVVRALGREGITVHGVTREPQSGCVSRYLTSCIVEEESERLIERLCDQFPSTEATYPAKAKPVLIPTSDQDVDLVLQHHERLAQHFAFQASYRNGLAALIMDKEHFYALCDEHGVAYPKLWKSKAGEIPSIRGAISYPCIIKPSRIHELKSMMRGKKGWIVNTADQLDDVLKAIPDTQSLFLLQEIIPGPESNISLYCGYLESNASFQPFTARKLRQYPPGFGSASLVQSAQDDESRAIAERLLHALNYEGIAAAEFKRDPDTGRLKIIEINVRPSLWFSITSAAGKHPVLASYCRLAGRVHAPEEKLQKDGVRWRYAVKDMWSSVFYRAKKRFVLPAPELSVLGRPRRRIYAVYSHDDPMPAILEIKHFANKLLRRLRKEVK